MPLKLSNNAIGTLVSALTASSTSVVLAPGQGAKFPALSSGEWFPITVVRASDPTFLEIMHVTARGGDVLTVQRAREGTTAITFSVGDMVEHRLTSGALDRDFVRVGAGGLDNVKFSVTADGDNLKATVQAGEKQEQLVRQKDLGTAATRDVTTSSVDSTSGRVLRTGDFGLGGFLPPLPSGNANTLKATGAYRTAGSWVGSPRAGVAGLNQGVLYHASWTEDYSTQTFRPIQASEEWIRHDNNGAWSPWREIYHTGNLNPVETSRIVGTGTGLTGGGNLSSDRTLSIDSAYWPLGVGQTWQNVTGSRQQDTTYTNTTGRTIAISIAGFPNGPSGTYSTTVYIEVNGVVRFAGAGSGKDSVRPQGVFGLIFPGEQYRVKSNYFTLQRWFESRG